MYRKDAKGYRLNTGESVRKDGRYTYSYTDRMGKRHYIYRKSLVEVREAEQKLHKCRFPRSVISDNGDMFAF